jgi:outer membrane protein insertion porin family
VTFHGLRTLEQSLVAQQVETRPGTLLSESRLAGDVRRLFALEALEDVRIDTTERFHQVLVEIHLRERPLLGSVRMPGASVETQRALGLSPGDLYEPARIGRLAASARTRLTSEGHLDAEITVLASARDEVVDLCVRVEEGPLFLVAELELVGNERITDEELLGVMETSEGRYNRLEKPFRADLFERDILHMNALYFDRGMVRATISPPQVERRRAGELVVRLDVHEGPVFRLGSARVDVGFPGSPNAYREIVATLQSGEIFSRSAVADVITRLEEAAAQQGNGDYLVTPVTEIDDEAHVIHITFQVEGSP